MKQGFISIEKGQHISQFGICPLDGFHRFVDILTDIFIFGKLQQVIVQASWGRYITPYDKLGRVCKWIVEKI